MRGEHIKLLAKETKPVIGRESISSSLANMEAWIDHKIADVYAFRATVSSVSGRLVAIQKQDEEEAGDEEYAICSGFDVAVSDEVLCVNIAGEPVIIGKIDAANPSVYTLSIPLLLSGSGDNQFTVEKSDGTDIFNVDTVDDYVDFINGSTARFFSGNYTGQTAHIDGADGSASFGSVNTPLFEVDSQTSPDSSNTTSTTVYESAMTTAISLPTGTWTIYALGGLRAKHSADGRLRLAVSVNGNDGTARTPTVPSGSFSAVMDDHIETGITGGVSINVVIKFRSVDAGTTTVENPFVIIVARRTA